MHKNMGHEVEIWVLYGFRELVWELVSVSLFLSLSLSRSLHLLGGPALLIFDI